MKLSKMRAKARAAFTNPNRAWILYRWDSDGQLHVVPTASGAGYTEVVVIRGRAFTRPQCAVQKDR